MSEEQQLDTQEVQPEDTRDVIAREFDKLDAQAKEDTPRDEGGKSSRKPAEAAPEKDENPLNQQKSVESDESQPEKEVAKEPERNPFAAWKKPAQEAIRALPPETQQYIIEREQQFHKGIQQYKEDAQRGKTLGQAVEPFSEYLQQLQTTPEKAINALLQTERKLRTGDQQTKTNEFLRLAHDYGVDINSLTNTSFDPYSYNLEQRLAQQQAMLEQLSQSRQMAEEAQLGQTIEQFAQSHEHFDEVRETMADLLDKGFASDLNDAYAKAVRLNDGLFNRMQTPQTNNLQRANEAAKAAKASAVSVKGSPTGVTRSPEPKSTEEAVRQAMAQMGL